MKEKFLVFAVSLILRVLGRSVRIRLHDEFGFFSVGRKGPCLVAAWHNRILMLPVIFRRNRRGQRLAVLTSASRDGGLLAAVVRRFGLEAVRGSSSRRGASALRELQAKLSEGCNVIITPDGPRGPQYHISPGILYLAGQTGLPLVGLQVRYSRYWQLKSWDRFRIPKPFSTVEITVRPALFMGRVADEADLVRASELLAKELHSSP